IKKLSFFFSVDGGEHYTPIGEVPYPTMVNDSYSFLWNIPLELQGSQICLVRVAATDDGNWTVSDDSDNYFTIVAEGGYTSLFFTNEYVDSLKDDSLYIFAFANSYPAAMGNTGPLPRYLNTVNSRTLGVVSDSLPDSDSTYYAPLPLWTQFSQRAEFVTVKGMPYADTIWPGWWTFYVYGNTDADTSRSENRSFDFEVFKVDSFGHRNTAVKLFSTYEPWLYDAVYKTSFNNWEEEETVKVFINHPFSIDIHDRLYVKCYYSGTFTNTGGPSGDISPKVYMTFGEFRNTRVVLPPKP
ncbi:MAG: hypothetical protein PHW02_09070, partial [bacterium]|nr:hypothetical protein [bacterium]